MIYLDFHLLFIKKDSQLHLSVIGKTAFCDLFQKAEIIRHIFVVIKNKQKKTFQPLQDFPPDFKISNKCMSTVSTYVTTLILNY